MKILKLTYLDDDYNEQELTLPANTRTIRIKLGARKHIEVELFERKYANGKITIRGSDTLKVVPQASNAIEVGLEK